MFVGKSCCSASILERLFASRSPGDAFHVHAPASVDSTPLSRTAVRYVFGQLKRANSWPAKLILKHLCLCVECVLVVRVMIVKVVRVVKVEKVVQLSVVLRLVIRCTILLCLLELHLMMLRMLWNNLVESWVLGKELIRNFLRM